MKIEKLFMKTNKNVEMTAYLLDSSKEMSNIDRRPAVLIFPGGGYYFTSDREAEPIAMRYAAEGFHTFVLRYSVGKETSFESVLQDAKEAIDMIRERSVAWGVDEKKVAVIGFSAGGHLAASLGTMVDKKSRPNVLLLGYPCILSKIGDVLAFPVPSVEKHVDEWTPPTFIFTTYEDSLVPVEHSLSFMNALARNKIPFESHVFQTGGHGLSLGESFTSDGLKAAVNKHFAQWFPLSVAWLHDVLGDFPVEKETISNENIGEYSINVSLETLLKAPQCREIMLEYLPNIEKSDKFNQIKTHSLHVLNQFLPNPFSEAMLSEINERLRAVSLQN